MSLPKVTGPQSQVFTTVPFDFPSLRLVLRVRYVPGPVMDRINEDGRQVNLQRLLHERGLAVAALISGGKTAAEADEEVPQVGAVGVLVGDVAAAVIGASVDGFYVDTPGVAGSDSVADDDNEPVWEPFNETDAYELWHGSIDPEADYERSNDDAWPSWAKDLLYLSVRNFSQRGTADPKAR
jgi:hypothetical protein